MPVDEKNVYAVDEYKNQFLTMTKEQILTAIINAVNKGEIGNIDAGFITKIQEMNDLQALRIWVGTMAEFQALEEKDAETLYLFTDDPTVTEIEQKMTELEEELDLLTQRVAALEAAGTAGEEDTTE